jgi:IS5 family transposase
VLYKAKRKIEYCKAQTRAKVEHPFRVIKRQFGYVKVRFRGLMKNTAQLTTLFALSNLWMARKQLMGMGVTRITRRNGLRSPDNAAHVTFRDQ